jgi:hypothetical protein
MNTLKIAKAVKEYLVQLAVNDSLPSDLTQLSEYKLGIAISEVLSPEIKALNDVLEKIKENTVSAYGSSLEDWETCNVVILEDFKSGDDEVAETSETTHYNKWFEDLEKLLKNFGMFKHEEPQYFLFGEEAVMFFDDGDGINKLVDEIANHNYTSYGVFKYTHKSNPLDLLKAIDGWCSFAGITEEHYNLIKNAEGESEKYIIFSDGHKFEKVSETFAMHNWAIMPIYGINVSEETESLIESLEDIAGFECFGIEITK